jgi:hypothetical protein
MFARGSNITTGLMILAFELFSKACLNRFRMIDSKRALDESSHNGSERGTVQPIHIASE